MKLKLFKNFKVPVVATAADMARQCPPRPRQRS